MARRNTWVHKSLINALYLISLISLTACSEQASRFEPDPNTFIRHEINSVNLGGKKRVFHVQVPASYLQNTDKTYPVIFHMLGRMRDITIARQSIFDLSQTKEIPEMIIVHLHHDGRNRDDIHPTNENGSKQSQADKYLDYLEQEAIPFMEDNYRVSDDRLFAGWSHFGVIATYIFSQKPDLFKAYVVSGLSPNDYLENLSTDIDNLFKSQPTLDTSFYAAIGTKGVKSPSKVAFDSLDRLLQNKAPDNLRWKTHKFEGMKQNEIYEIGLRDGLKFYFKGD